LDNSTIFITGMYGPSSGPRGDFLQQIKQAKPNLNVPWIICGDFNMVLRSEERSTNVLKPRDRDFKNLVDELGLIDLLIQGRNFTWSNGRDQSSFIRHDKFIISSQWSCRFPATTQTALNNIVSDHCPVLCTTETNFPLPNIFKFENY
jgi:endonuclease/exonuclease/phosphatase family metal-dependent hydrolase